MTYARMDTHYLLYIYDCLKVDYISDLPKQIFYSSMECMNWTLKAFIYVTVYSQNLAGVAIELELPASMSKFLVSPATRPRGENRQDCLHPIESQKTKQQSQALPDG